eukprot:TRINITY_DN1495_c0_g1_i1.p1 TRINITY_DN1495_c0_g1~~TRINITY_DN1495_c0_g1_i1.p1  ORF type:complete len:268 (-),score=64.74 TRINITY_DN1495_c0_g1_i1:94-897(-)
MVLTAGSWPLQGQPVSFSVPQELEGCVSVFSDFYTGKYHGRKLSWLHHLSKGEVRAACPAAMKRPYEFQVTTFQMGVLLAFNTADANTLDALSAATKLSDDELERTITSLVDCKLLTKKPPSKNFAGTDEFRINAGFANKRLKIKVVGAVRTERPEETPATYKGVEEDRKMYLQAAIVRIMKARKELKHVQLVQEVIAQAKGRFQPSVPVIKKCIEGLIEKECAPQRTRHSSRTPFLPSPTHPLHTWFLGSFNGTRLRATSTHISRK